jgi:hypothetical protein
MRIRGKPLREIAAAEGISKTRAIQDLQAILSVKDENIARMAKIERRLQNDRLEKAIQMTWQQAETNLQTQKRLAEQTDEDGNPVEDGGASPLINMHFLKCMDTLIKLEARRAALLGLDAPTSNIALTGQLPTGPDMITRAAELMRQKFGLVAKEVPALQAEGVETDDREEVCG